MAVNMVVVNNEAVIDLTNDTVTTDTLLSGTTAHDASGSQIVGTYALPDYGYTLPDDGNAGDIFLLLEE